MPSPLVGIALTNCKNIKIESSNLGYYVGMWIRESDNIYIQNNTFDKGFINIAYGENITIINNSFSVNLTRYHFMQDYYYGRGGMALGIVSCKNLNITDNFISDYKIGLHTADVTNCIIERNSLIRSRFDVLPDNNYPIIDESNTVNGRRFYFYKEKSNLDMNNFTNAGQIFLYKCSNSIVEGAYVEYLEDGFQVNYGSNITIRNNIIIYSFNSGMYIFNLHDSTIINNTILGFSYNCQSYKDLVISVIGMNIRGDGDQTNNINVTINTICGYKFGIHIWAYLVGWRMVTNITVWDNYFANNQINGQQTTEIYGQEYTDIKFNNVSVGNFWDDYSSPRISGGIPSSSGTYSTAYRVNGVYDYHPLDSYDHPLFLPELNPLFSWTYDEYTDDPTIWIVIGIIGGCAAVAVVFLYLRKSGRIGDKISFNLK